MPLSTHPWLFTSCYVLGIGSAGLGINALFRPAFASQAFDVPEPTLPKDRDVVESLGIVYGIRDVFMGLGICSAVYYRETRTLGVMIVLASGVALVDGLASRVNGGAAGKHWGLVPVLVGVGATVLGAFDGF